MLVAVVCYEEHITHSLFSTVVYNGKFNIAASVFQRLVECDLSLCCCWRELHLAVEHQFAFIAEEVVHAIVVSVTSIDAYRKFQILCRSECSVVESYSRKLVAILRINSCYNTNEAYGNAGLPCGPISNPSLAALTAAANPTDSSYLYFLTGDDGTMYYGSTAAQHEQNRYRYCKVRCNIAL